jgi:homogentisate 1,2-dioxygenase
MLHRHTLGEVPAKPHTAFLDASGQMLMEVCVTREGFDGPFSILYYRTPPTNETRAEPLELPGFCPVQQVDNGILQRRHLRTQDAAPAGDFLTGRRTLCVNDTVHVSIGKPAAPADRFFSNGDGDELFFVKSGGGVLESIYGVLPFREHDYLLIP